jgi:hypothetical protein
MSGPIRGTIGNSTAGRAETRPPSLAIAEKDCLGFWTDGCLNARRVVAFVALDRRDVARLAGISLASVRFDQKIPREVVELLSDIANTCGLVAEYFGGDAGKTALWFRTENPLLGNISPREMIRYGRHKRLRHFVMSAVEDNARAPAVSSCAPVIHS